MNGRRASMDLAERIATLPRPLHLVFDFDGTLSPLAPTPDAARLPARTRRALARLSEIPDVHVGILSARRVVELVKRVRLARVALVGLYGLEERRPGRPPEKLPLDWDPSFWQELRSELERETRGTGAFLEWKPPAIAVHYRGLSPAAASAVKQAVWDLARREARTVEVRPGAKVLELVPRGMPDKGRALARMLALCGPGRSVVYFGDSAADEPAFRSVRAEGGLAVRVGKPPRHSAAAEHVRGPAELCTVLEAVVARASTPPFRRSA